MTTNNTIQLNVQTTTDPIQQLIQSVNTLNTTMQTTGQRSQQTTQQVTSAWDKLKKKITETITSVSGLQGVFETIMGGTIVKSMGDAIKSVESLSNQVSVLRQNAKFSEIAQDFENISEITGGLANKFDMVGSISRAMAFNIDLSGGKLKELIQVAQKTAVIMGTDLKTAFDDLITGVSRGSVPILDNLGIVVEVEAANQKYAASLGKTTDELSKAEKTTALLNEVITKLKQNTANVDLTQLEQSGTKAVKIMEDSLEKAKKFIVEGFVDFGTSIGETLAEAFLSVDEKLDYFLAEYRKKREADFKKQFGDLIKWMDEQTARFQTGMTEGEGEQTSAAQNIANQFDFNRFKTDEEIESAAERKKARRFAKIQKDYDEGQELITKNNEKIARLRTETAKIWVQAEEFGLSDIDKIQSQIAKIQEQKKSLGKDDVAQAELEKLKAQEFLLNQELAKAEINVERDKQLAIQDLIKQTYDIDLALSEQKKEYEAKLREENKKALEIDLRDKEKYFNMFSGLMSSSIDALFSGSADSFEQVLLNFANTFGTTLIMDGIKTLWMGNAKNALFPGWGVDAVGVGAAEIGVGIAMKAGAYLGGSVGMGSQSATAEGQSATERSQGGQNMTFNVTASLYGTKKEAQKGLSEVMR